MLFHTGGCSGWTKLLLPLQQQMTIGCCHLSAPEVTLIIASSPETASPLFVLLPPHPSPSAVTVYSGNIWFIIRIIKQAEPWLFNLPSREHPLGVERDNMCVPELSSVTKLTENLAEQEGDFWEWLLKVMGKGEIN